MQADPLKTSLTTSATPLTIAIIALGSRGDVQPYVALGMGLKRAGFQVRIVTHENFQTFVTSHGLEFRSMRGNVQEIAQSEEMRKLLEGGNFLAITMRTAKEARKAALQWAEDGLDACAGVDLMIGGIGGMFTALMLGEKLDIPVLQAHLIPFTPTRDFPSVLLPQGMSALGGAFNHASHHLSRQMIWQGSRSSDNAARQEVLDLPRVPFMGPFGHERLRELPTLYGISPSVIPKPSDWAEDIHMTGYWFIESGDGWQPPTDLLDFLDAGPAPVCIGFGSMGNRNPEETVSLVIKALQLSGQRGVLLSGWNGMSKRDLPDSVFMMDAAPHTWLFPRMAAVVHHGGAGTTAAGLRAGVPSILTPFFADQPFWGHRVASLGVGPQPIRHKKLTAEGLAQAITTTVTDTRMREKAAALGQKIRAEDGVGNAVNIIKTAINQLKGIPAGV